MTYVKINNNIYPATINGYMNDTLWDNRKSKAITLEMDYETALNTFIDGLSWFILAENLSFQNGEQIITTEEYDNSDYCVAGPITDNRDGTMTVKMGRFTELEEAYAMLLGGVE